MVDTVPKIKDGGPYANNDDIIVGYELKFKNDLIKPGILIKFKGSRGQYKFRCVAHNPRLDVTWIDCIDAITHEWRSFYIDRLIGVVKPKRSRRRRAIT